MLSPRFSTKSYEPHPNLTVGVLGLGPEGAPSEIKFRSLSKLTWKSVPGWSFRANSDEFEPRDAFSSHVGLGFEDFRKGQGNLTACRAGVREFCDVVRLGFEV